MSEKVEADDVRNPYTNIYTQATTREADEIIVLAMVEKYWVFEEVCYFLAEKEEAPETARVAFQSDADSAHFLAKELTERYAAVLGTSEWPHPDADPWDEDQWGERYCQDMRDYVSAMFENEEQAIEVLATAAARQAALIE
ncbi:MAG: hypothetical protein HN396_18410 [Gemmatimonadales bacterium]|nr:hypothetical protein [Gemmatimonadales bacterium]